jgi:hypothetical protein
MLIPSKEHTKLACASALEGYHRRTFLKKSNSATIPMPSKRHLHCIPLVVKWLQCLTLLNIWGNLDTEGEDTCVLASDGGSTGVLENVVWHAFHF